MGLSESELGLSLIGLPLGVQLIGDRYDDHRFLGVANWLEKECNN